MKTIIRSIHFDADAKLMDFIHEKMDKLDQYFDGILGGEVYLRLDKSNVKENKVAEVKLNIPGKDVFAKKQCKTFEEATDEAVNAIIKQIKKHKDKLKRQFDYKTVD